MNYLEEIESEFSRIRGKWTPLAPIDWALAQSWEEKQIPLSVVFRGMEDVHKKFIAANPKRTDTINSLRYFEKGVDKHFAEWQTSQVGKYEIGFDPASPNGDQSALVIIEDGKVSQVSFEITEEVEILTLLIEGLKHKNLPEPLRSATTKARDEIGALIEEFYNNESLGCTGIENRLEAIAADLDLSLVVSLPEDVRARLLVTINRDYAKININAESRQKLLIKQAYQHFGLPKLTLFEL